MTTPARRASLAATLWLAAGITSTQSLAQQVQEEIVVTGARQAQQLREFVGSISRVDAQAVDGLGATHHNEIINRAPGAMIQRNSGQESLTALRSPVLTGPGSCGTFLFLENSIPIRPTGFCNVNELFEVHTEQAGAIEVLRGPAGVVYGSGAMHGAINVLSSVPTGAPGMSLSLEAGPDEFYRGKLGVNHASQTLDAGAALLVTHDGGWRDQAGLDEQKLSLGMTHRSAAATTRVNFTATNLQQETAGFIQGYNTYRDERIARSNANPEAYRDAYAMRLTGSYERALNDNTLLTLHPYVRHSRMDFRQHFLVGKPLEENGQDSLGLISALNFTLPGEGQVLTGIDIEFAQGFLQETQDGPATDGAPAANLIRPAGKHYDYEVQSRVAALYGQLEQPFAGRFKASVGARLEYVNYDYDNRMIAGNTRDDGTSCTAAGCLYARPADRSDDFTNFTSKLGLSYSLTDDHMLYVSAARGYRAPDTSELYRLQRQQSIAELDAERLDSIEVGARGAVGELRYSLAGFVMTKDNVIFRDSNAFNVSDGRTDHEGIEYELQWAPMPSVSLAIAGTYARHTYDFNRAVEGGETIIAGRDIDTAPRHVNTARVNWSFLPGAHAELEWLSVGRYFLDAGNNHEYGGHDLLNLRVSWRASQHWSTALRLNNLTDRAYADRADFAFGNYRYFPGRGRHAFLEVRYHQ